MHLAVVAASVLVAHSGIVSPGDPVTVRVVGSAPRTPLHVYMADSAGVRHRFATIPGGRSSVTVRFPRLPVDYYRLVGGRGTFAVRSQPPAGFGAPGASGCAPPSPSIGNEMFGTAAGAQFWALTFGALDGVVGKQTKIVFRMARFPPRVFYAVSPDGRHVGPDWREPHTGSNWQRPGFEWGAGFTFDVPGCWRIHAGAFPAQGDLWLVVNS
jgi:hypothetical protein